MRAGTLSLLALALLGTGTASAQSGSQVGSLSCDVSRGVGLILVEKQKLNCVFQSSGGLPPQRYVGSIDTYGVAIGGVQTGHLVWGVIAATKGVPQGALAGTYAGVGAEATAVVGIGANVLVGGSGRAFSLQPISIEGQVGVNIAAGVTTVTLTYAP